jgi:hypothetical protein
MRAPLIAAAAAVALASGPASVASAKADRAAQSAAPDSTRGWRIGDRPEPQRWRMLRDPERLGLPATRDESFFAALDASVVEMDHTGAIVRFVTL